MDASVEDGFKAITMALEALVRFQETGDRRGFVQAQEHLETAKNKIRKRKEEEEKR